MSPKNNIEDFEVPLLGSIFINPESFEKLKGLLVASDFFNEKNKVLFQAIEDIFDQGFTIEQIPILNLIKKENKMELINSDYIDYVISEAGLLSNQIKYAESIVEKSRLRQVQKEITTIQSKIKIDNMSADDILQRIEMDIISNARDNSRKEFKTVKEVVEEVIIDIQKKLAGEMVSGIPTGYKDLDDLTGGLHKGDLIILAARPSMGKTALALNIAANVSKRKRVAFFSIEMPSKQLVNRIIGFTGFLTSNKLQKPKFMTQSDKQKFTIAYEKTKKLNLHLDDSPGIKLSELVWKAKRLKKNQGLDLIVIDYLQLISASSSGDNRQNEVSTISRTLKKLARELSVPIIALSQLSRKVEQRESKVPMMSDLRESGAIEQDADLIAFVYREAYYKPKESQEANKPNKTQIIIGKHRNGPTGIVNLSFNPEYGLFLDAIRNKEENE